MTNIRIFGAGISGLTNAYRIHSFADVTLVEPRNRIGGASKRVRSMDTYWNMAPILFATPAFYRRIQELGVDGEVVRAKPQLSRYIAKKGAGGA